MPASLLVVAGVDGNVWLFTPLGEMVLTFSAGHERPVTHLATSPSQDEYMIATSDDSGVIRVHKIGVRQRRLSRDERLYRRSSTEEKMSQYMGSQVNVTMQFQKQIRMPKSKQTGAVPQLTALLLASQQGTKYFVTGDRDGSVHVFTKNGTLRARINVSAGASVDSLTAHVGSILFRVGGEFGFLDLDKLEVKYMDCPRFDRHVTAVMLDSQQTSRVIVADTDGTVWVLNARDRGFCRVDHRFQRGVTRGQVVLASVRGFALGLEHTSRGSTVVALNMSHIGKRKYELREAPSPVVWRHHRPRTKDWAVHKRYQQGDLLAFLSEDGLDIEIFELLMQVYIPPGEDSFSNFKLPVIAVAVILVLGYQYTRQKGMFGAAMEQGMDGGGFGGGLGGGGDRGLGGGGGGRRGGGGGYGGGGGRY